MPVEGGGGVRQARRERGLVGGKGCCTVHLCVWAKVVKGQCPCMRRGTSREIGAPEPLSGVHSSVPPSACQADALRRRPCTFNSIVKRARPSVTEPFVGRGVLLGAAR